MADIRTELAESRAGLRAADSKLQHLSAAIQARRAEWQPLQYRIVQHTEANDLEGLKDALTEQEALTRILKSLDEQMTRAGREREQAEQRYGQASRELVQWKKQIEEFAASIAWNGSFTREYEELERQLQQLEQRRIEYQAGREQREQQILLARATLAAIEEDQRLAELAEQESSQ